MKKLFNVIFSGFFGLLFPLIVSVILLEKLHLILLPVSHWVESHLHITRALGVLGIFIISIFLMLLLGYLAGLILTSSFVKRQVEKYERNVLSKIPMYNLLKTILGSQAGIGSGSDFRPGLLRDDEGFSLCYVTSESKHYFTICLIGGGLNGGDVKIVHKSKVHILNITLQEFSRLVKQYGINSAALAEDYIIKEETKSL